jgi:DNA-binding LytR/AlgR family response regulator
MSRQLDPDTFLRVHRSFLVNADHIREIQPWSHGDHLIVMRDGAKVRLSRRYRHRLPPSLRKSL